MLVSVTEFFSRVPKSQGEAKQMLGAEWRSANPIRIQSNLRKCPIMIVYWQISYPSKARKRAEMIIGMSGDSTDHRFFEMRWDS